MTPCCEQWPLVVNNDPMFWTMTHVVKYDPMMWTMTPCCELWQYSDKSSTSYTWVHIHNHVHLFTNTGVMWPEPPTGFCANLPHGILHSPDGSRLPNPLEVILQSLAFTHTYTFNRKIRKTLSNPAKPWCPGTPESGRSGSTLENAAKLRSRDPNLQRMEEYKMVKYDKNKECHSNLTFLNLSLCIITLVTVTFQNRRLWWMIEKIVLYRQIPCTMWPCPER